MVSFKLVLLAAAGIVQLAAPVAADLTPKKHMHVARAFEARVAPAQHELRALDDTPGRMRFKKRHSKHWSIHHHLLPSSAAGSGSGSAAPTGSPLGPGSDSSGSDTGSSSSHAGSSGSSPGSDDSCDDSSSSPSSAAASSASKGGMHYKGGSGSSSKSSSAHSSSSASSSASWKSGSGSSSSSSSSSGSGSGSSSNSGYSKQQLQSDLKSFLSSVGDENNAQADQDEYVEAIYDAAQRYWPELPLELVCRTIMADIRTESDFQAKMVDGSAWGALQVTPGGSSGELEMFKQHATTQNTYSWGGKGKMGTLIDYKTKKPMDLQSLTNQDLLRPWVNIHVAEWVQSNEARTGSADPGEWSNLASQAKNGGRISGINSGIQATLATGLGTWLAGPNADSGFQTSGDKGSQKYISDVTSALSHFYGGHAPSLTQHTVKQGLVDFH